MTIREVGFWIYLLCIFVSGVGVWLTIFAVIANFVTQ